MDRRTAVRAGLGQTVAVAALSVALALALPHSFFEDWGWLAGPGAWLACAAAVVLGVHWLGAAVAIVVWALWCGRLAVDRGVTAEAL